MRGPSIEFPSAFLDTILSDCSVDAGSFEPLELLATMIDLADSVQLSDSLRALRRESAIEPVSEIATDEGLAELLLTGHQRLVERIESAFEREGVHPALALPEMPTSIDGELLQRYQRFYSLQQSELEAELMALRQTIRVALSALPNSQGLLGLDAELEKVFGPSIRRALSSSSRLLEVWHSQAIRPEEFEQRLKRLLLCELELRTQPLVGMVAATMDEESITS